MIHPEDFELAKAMAKGQDAAFRLFFDRYFPRIYRFCCRRVDEQMSEEVTQTALINAVRNIASYRGDASLFTWLCQIARNEVAAHKRRQATQPGLVAIEGSEEVRREVESLGADPELNPEHALEHNRNNTFIHEVLDHLPGTYGLVLEWKYVDEYSVDEIASRLGVTVIAAQSMLARARSAFRKQYDLMNPEILDAATNPSRPWKP